MVARDGFRGTGVVRDAGSSRSPMDPSPARPRPRSCARPGCPVPAAATLRFAYTAREAVIEPLGDDPRPQTYDLCGSHASRTRPPHGWTLRDLLPTEPAHEASPGPGPAPAPIGGRDTVALLAAAFEAAANGSRPVR